MSVDRVSPSDRDSVLRDRAVARLKKRRDFRTHLVVYVLVNGMIVVIWALTNRHGLFWPMFAILGWGIGLVLNGWDVYRREELTDQQIEREIGRLRQRG
jgi:hypothetical protein